MTNKEKLAEMLMQEIYGGAIIGTEDDIKHIREGFIKVVDRLIANGVVRPQGEWIKHYFSYGTPECSICGWRVPYSEDSDLDARNFCPNCGADMRKR